MNVPKSIERIRYHLQRVSGDGYDWQVELDPAETMKAKVRLGSETTAVDPDGFDPLGLDVSKALRFLPLLPACAEVGEEGQPGTLVDFLVVLSGGSTVECDAYVLEHWRDDASEIE
jgi:hypothetical protein